MKQSHNRTDIQAAKAFQPQIGEPPVGVFGKTWRRSLPDHRLAKRSYAYFSKSIEVFDSCWVAQTIKLFEVCIAYTIDGAFNTAPHFGGI
jgi:hypothetical protein